MSFVFITGSDASFFPTLLVTIQSFSVRFPAQRLLVCDYGLNTQQRNFLLAKGQLLERPPTLASDAHYLACKAAMIRYLQHAGYQLEKYDTVVWLDADITFMDIAIDDFDTVLDAMKQNNAEIAACETGYSIGQISELFKNELILAPFKELLTNNHIDLNLPYLSVGLFICRSQKFLENWDTLTSSTLVHNLLEMNTFNILIYRDQIKLINLDFEEWQANGASLDRIEIYVDSSNGPTALIDGKNIKAIHTTSSEHNHVLITKGEITVFDVFLLGNFKLLMAQHLRQMQLVLLATYIAENKTMLLQFDICKTNTISIDGFEFIALPYAPFEERPDFK